MQYPIISLINYFRYQTLCPNTSKCFLKEEWVGNSPFATSAPLKLPVSQCWSFTIFLCFAIFY